MDRAEAINRHLLEQESANIANIINSMSEEGRDRVVQLLTEMGRAEGTDYLAGQGEGWWQFMQLMARCGLRHTILQRCSYGLDI